MSWFSQEGLNRFYQLPFIEIFCLMLLAGPVWMLVGDLLTKLYCAWADTSVPEGFFETRAHIYGDTVLAVAIAVGAFVVKRTDFNENHTWLFVLSLAFGLLVAIGFWVVIPKAGHHDYMVEDGGWRPLGYLHFFYVWFVAGLLTNLLVIFILTQVREYTWTSSGFLLLALGCIFFWMLMCQMDANDERHLRAMGVESGSLQGPLPFIKW